MPTIEDPSSGPQFEHQPDFYPLRPSLSLERDIHAIQEQLDNPTESLKLSSIEIEHLLAFEETFYTSLAEIQSVPDKKFTLYPEFLISGTKEALGFLEKYDIQIDTFSDILEIINDWPEEVVREFGTASIKWSGEEMVRRLKEGIQPDSYTLSVDDVQNLTRVLYNTHPEGITTKLEKLRILKSTLKDELSILYNESDPTKLTQAKTFVLNLYRERVNTMLALTMAEHTVNDARHVAQLDKFVNGVSELTSSRDYIQVGQKLSEFANELAEKNETVQKSKEDYLIERNLDPERINNKKITAEELKAYAESQLQQLGLMSDYEASLEDIQNKIIAPDNKWRVLIHPSRKSMEVFHGSKILALGYTDKPIESVLTVALGHEFVHILQGENTKTVPLKFYSGDTSFSDPRALVFAEGGAMYVQNQLSEDIFGYESPPKPHYIRTMITRQEGGNFLECVKTYYESIMSITPETERMSSSTQEKALNAAISSTKRIFLFTDPQDQSPHLGRSKDTAYLEQKAVLENVMKIPELEGLAFIRGITLRNAKELMKFGLLTLDNLKTLESKPRDLWESLQEGYTL